MFFIMKRFFIAFVFAFTLFPGKLFCQTTNNYIASLNSYYERFTHDVRQYGESSTQSVESFKRMLNYYNGLPKDQLYDRSLVSQLIEANIRWENILNEISRGHSPEFFLRLQKANLENNKQANKDLYLADEKEIESLYDGGEGIRAQLDLDKSDLFLATLYDRAEFAASLNNLENVLETVRQWFSVWDKSEKAYSSKDDFDKCIFLYAKYLSVTMFNSGMQSQAIGLLMDLEKKYNDNGSKTPAVEESIENTHLWISILLGNIGDTESQMYYSSHAFLFSYSTYYDINNYLLLLSDYAKITRDLDPNQSVELLEKAERIINLERVGKNGRPASRRTKSMVFNELSQSYLRTKNYDKQLIAIKKAIQEDGDNFEPGHYHNLASAYADVGDYDNAMEIYQLLEANNALSIDSYSNLATIAHLQGKYEQTTAYAEKYFNGIVSDFQNMTRFMTPRVRESYFSNNYHLRYFYNTLTAFAEDNPLGTGLAYNASLYQKGLLVRMNNETRRRINASDNNDLKQAYADYLYSLAYGDNEIASISESSLQALFPKYLNFTDESFSLKWEDIRSALNTDEVAIEFVTYLDFVKKENNYAALVLKKGYDAPRMIKLCGCNDLNSFFSNVDAYGCPRVYENIIEPSAKIWGPLADVLSNVKTVYYSPCEALSQINMDIMTLDSSGKPMNQLFRMVRMLSTADLLGKRSFEYVTASLMGGFDYGNVASSNNSVQGDSFRGFNRVTGWDALESLEEIEGIKQSLSKKTTVSLVMGGRADEITIKSISGNSPSIMHLATHGYYLGLPEARKFAYFSSYEEDRWIPEDVRCGLILSGANDAWLGKAPAGGNDGTLTAEEINGLDLSNTELVVLSACQTGLGENTSEGTYGLMRAFKNAGVGSIIMSLWEVNDEATILFMTTFYKQLANGKERHIAFNKAQETVKKKYPEARYWAAFVMVD